MTVKIFYYLHFRSGKPRWISKQIMSHFKKVLSKVDLTFDFDFVHTKNHCQHPTWHTLTEDPVERRSLA